MGWEDQLMSGLNARGLTLALASHFGKLGRFDTVNRHEPKNAPGKGLRASIWLGSVGPARGQSGLSVTSALAVFKARLYASMLSEPQDEIDEDLLTAVSAVIESLSADFDLGGLVESIDLLGKSGTALAGAAGYLEQDGKMFRVFTFDIPLIVNDVWPQSP
jgi:hypothetical protein